MIPHDPEMTVRDNQMTTLGESPFAQYLSMGVGDFINDALNPKMAVPDVDGISRNPLDAFDDERSNRNVRGHARVGSEGNEIPLDHGLLLTIDQVPACIPIKAQDALLIMADDEAMGEPGHQGMDQDKDKNGIHKTFEDDHLA